MNPKTTSTPNLKSRAADRLAAISDTVHLGAGERLARAGARTNHGFLVIEGRVACGDRVLAEGETWLIASDQRLWPYNVDAVTAAVVLVVDRRRLAEIHRLVPSATTPRTEAARVPAACSAPQVEPVGS